MTITEALKELKLIMKKLDTNRNRITEYSSGLEKWKPHFETAEKQREEVAKLVQSNEDLVTNYMKMKQRIDKTNLVVTLQFADKTYTIAELILLKRLMGVELERTYLSMNNNSAKTNRIVGAESSIPVLYYDERLKSEKLNSVQDLLGRVDGRLETINAVTEIVSE